MTIKIPSREVRLEFEDESVLHISVFEQGLGKVKLVIPGQVFVVRKFSLRAAAQQILDMCEEKEP